jgi:hypothetical protein
MPRMLRELISQTVVAQPDMLVVGSYPGDVPLDAAADAADLVITGDPPPTSEEIARAVDDRPDLVVVAVLDDGRRSLLFRRGTRQELGELSPGDIVAAFRAGREG